MNSKFKTLSLAQIQAKLSHLDFNSLGILEWDQVSLWQEKISTLEQKSHLPRYLVIPNTKDILSQFLKICDEQKWRICILGNGSKLSWGKLPQDFDIFVSTTKLNNIIEHAVDDLIVTVESGIKLSDLQNFLSLQGQFLPINPFYLESATVGGIVATANTGSWRQRYGGIRDLILGISFLRHDGQEVKAGGKVVKNVAGYDLMKLLTGSYGNLGLITSVTFRLFPLPEYSSSILLSGEQKAMQKIRSTIASSSLTPTMADLLSPPIVDNLGLGSKQIGLRLRFQSIEASVQEQLQQIETWANELGLSTQIYQEADETSLCSLLDEKAHALNEEASILAKVGILPSQAVDFLAQCQGDCMLNLSTGVGYGLWSPDKTTADMQKLRTECETNSGFFTLLEAPISMKEEIEPWGYVGNGLKMMKTIKQNFDPQDIFVDRL